MHSIAYELQKRILILDGAMGTMIQTYGLAEKDFRNEYLKNHPVDLKGNNDILNITRPDVIREIHLQYLEAGADIIETNTFNGNSISQEDYQTAEFVYEINLQGARIAREAADKVQQRHPGKKLFVAGAMGPSTRLASMSPVVNDPGYRAVTFNDLTKAYTEQAKALIEGGVDLFLLETITDTLNVKAALFALMELFDETGEEYPIMVSGTITDASGRILSGQTIEAFLVSVSHAPLLSVGLNCALGAAELRPYVQVLDKECSFFVSTHPNAGLPNQFGEYDQSPEELALLIREFALKGWLNIVGGCCGTTPAHIKALSEALSGIQPRVSTFIQRYSRTSNKVRQQVTNWTKNPSRSGRPAFSMKELIHMLSDIEDETTFFELKNAFEKEKNLFHSEQAMLLNAHIFGRYSYLRETGKLEKRKSS